MSSISPRSGSPQASGSTRRLSDSSQDVSSRVAPSAVSHIPRVGIVFAGAADLTSPGGLAKKICATVITALIPSPGDRVLVLGTWYLQVDYTWVGGLPKLRVVPAVRR